MIALLCLSFYVGSLFFLILVVAPSIFKVLSSKEEAGRLYGTILNKFYKISYLNLFIFMIFSKFHFIGAVLIVFLSFNYILSYYMKALKRKMGNIEKIDFDNEIRVKFRRLSKLSTALLVFNFLISSFIMFKVLNNI